MLLSHRAKAAQCDLEPAIFFEKFATKYHWIYKSRQNFGVSRSNQEMPIEDSIMAPNDLNPL